jgi:Na+-transporting methylmalonyl-CoA/oxaloacetate decarboxylase gamma subunit
MKPYLKHLGLAVVLMILAVLLLVFFVPRSEATPTSSELWQQEQKAIETKQASINAHKTEIAILEAAIVTHRAKQAELELAGKKLRGEPVF